jgi:hypothetical protein
MAEKTSNAMWGGRFASGPDAIMEAINASIGFDQRLAAQDIAGSRAHAAMLAAVGILADSDAEAIREGLLTVLGEIEAGTFRFSTALEDIHMNVESRLAELIGEPAKRLHTARSRNDRWRPTSAFGSATNATRPTARSPRSSARSSARPRRGPPGSCPASPTSRAPARHLGPPHAGLWSRCFRATAGALPTRGLG